jgi:hypothetical protein
MTVSDVLSQEFHERESRSSMVIMGVIIHKKAT